MKGEKWRRISKEEFQKILHLLSTTDMTVREIALRVNRSAHTIRLIKNQTGVREKYSRPSDEARYRWCSPT